MRFDIIVIGAGPSGSTLSRILAEAGIKVLLLEKKELPYTEKNEKVCAGVLNPSGIEALGGIPSEIIERQIKMAEWISKSGYRGNFPFKNKRNINAVTVNRRDLDNWLVELSQNSGVTLISNLKVKNIEFMNGQIKVLTQKGDYIAPFIVGCGGFTCPVAKKIAKIRNIRFRRRDNSVITCQNIIKVPKNVIEEFFNEKIRVFLDYSLAPFGYFYLIPHTDSLYVGMGYLLKNQPKNKKITDFLENGLKDPRISSLLGGDYQILQRRIWFVVYQKNFPKFNEIIGPNWALTGESANLVTPFVGSGITPGIISSKILGKFLIPYFETENQDVLKFYYDELSITLKNRFSSENALSRLLTSNRRMDNFVKFISNHPEYLEKAIVEQKKLNFMEKLKILIHTIF
ncbi:MAG: NAD(P)/FAD-dependent oxidoreductase [Candidatus Helarchaeota archaeon]|nr:NAD(P)/FAD-dependent oxidoreductase [Candidatus Helarchaeota archaeon]